MPRSLEVAIAFVVHAFRGHAQACTEEQWLDDTCTWINDAECDVSSGVCEAGSDCSDCDRCSLLGLLGCSSCVAEGCSWCVATASCLSASGVPHLSCSDGWAESCSASDLLVADRIFNDPVVELQRWWLEAINVGPAWDLGLSGSGVNIFFLDDGLDFDHPEFAGRYVSALEVSGDTVMPSNQASTHGTSCAGFAAAGANNSVCGVGIAFEAGVAGATYTAGSEPIFTVGVADGTVHVHSHSWGTDACDKDHDFFATTTAECPFDARWSNSPCVASACAGVNWRQDLSPVHLCTIEIIRYCDRPNQYSDTAGPYDPACSDYWDLWVSCVHQALSNQNSELLRNGVTTGRGGKGVIYVFASGNEYEIGDNVNFEGWLNSIYTISVAGTAMDGKHAVYSSAGAPVHVSAPGGESGNGRMVTALASVAGGGQCHDAGAGTSFACPIVAGVVALMLEANSLLGWRDVQDILARTSQHVDPSDASWTTNGGGLKHSNKYGFGQIDAGAAVIASQEWRPEQSTLQALFAKDISVELAIPTGGNDVSCAVDVGPTEVSFMESIEHVVVYVTTTGHTNRGDIEFELTSPAGTVSVLTWQHDERGNDYTNWKFMTVRNWGESPNGQWTLMVSDRKENSATGSLSSWILAIYGKCNSTDLASCRSVSQRPPETVCEDTCEHAGDGECDDGGPDAAYFACSYGTDCSDCGARTMTTEYEHVGDGVGQEGVLMCSAISRGFRPLMNTSGAGRGQASSGSMQAAGPARATVRTNCCCQERWRMEGAGTAENEWTCSSYCCNPDNDPGGEWCFVQDPDCEGHAWSHCAPLEEAPSECGAAIDDTASVSDVASQDGDSRARVATAAAVVSHLSTPLLAFLLLLCNFNVGCIPRL